MAFNEADHIILNDPVKSFFFFFFVKNILKITKQQFTSALNVNVNFSFVAACWGWKSAFFCFQQDCEEAILALITGAVWEEALRLVCEKYHHFLFFNFSLLIYCFLILPFCKEFQQLIQHLKASR